MNILFIVFGNNINYHFQAIFSIYTFLAKKNEAVTINVLTDKPAMYNAVKEQINILQIEHEILNEWKGEFDFFWRIKIKAIQHLCQMFEGQHILYLDSDTFLFGDISFLIDQLNNGCSFMHMNEGKSASFKTKTEKLMWKQINNNSYGSIIHQTHLHISTKHPGADFFSTINFQLLNHFFIQWNCRIRFCSLDKRRTVTFFCRGM